MTAPGLIRSGARAAARNAGLLWWLLAGNLALALAAVLPLLGPLEGSLAHHEASDQMSRRFDVSWWVDVTAENAESFARALDAISVAAFLSAMMGCFFAGGLIQAYHDTLGDLPVDRFMTSCRRWFPRFVLLFVLTLPLYWVAHETINTHVASALEGLLEHVEDERLGLLIQTGRSLLFLVLFDLVTLMGDYARAHAVVSVERSMLRSLWAGIRFVAAHPARVLSLELFAILAQALALALFLPVDRLLLASGGSAAGLVAIFLAAQSFLLLRLFLREAARGAQVALYRQVAPAP